MKTNSEIRTLALDSLKGRWWEAIIVVIAFLAMGVASAIISGGQNASLVRSLFGMVIQTFIFIPLGFAAYNAYRSYTMHQSDEVLVPMISECKSNYGKYLLTGILLGIVMIIGFLLFIIPGIILDLGFCMFPFIIKDNPELGVIDVLKKSWQMTKGYKGWLFLMELGFALWLILGIFTLGIAYFWLIPYIYCTIGQFYEELKANA